MMKKRVTLDDIAAATNASPATVSLALRNRAGVSSERRAEILDTARALGYIPRSRATDHGISEVRTVGLLFRAPGAVGERTAQTMNHFYSSVLAGMQDGASERRMSLLLGTIPVDADCRPITLPDLLLSRPLDGLLLVGALQPDIVAAVRERFVADRAAMVLVDAHAGPLGIDAVTSDHRQGMADATRHLIAAGHRRIGFAGLPPGRDANFDRRRAGYAEMMRAHGLTTRDVEMEDDSESARRALLDHRHEITALACANDYTAHLLVHAARRVGIDVPGEVSLVGFDDTVEARQSHPTLSTMAVDKVGLGLIAVAMLHTRLGRPDTAPMQMSLGVRLIERESVAPPSHPGGTIATPIVPDTERES